MNRRQSTNVKLVAIINQKNNDQEEEEVVRNTEKEAKIRLRRTCLYGGGARTKIPKIKLRKKGFISPIKMGHGAELEHLKEPKQFETSIPPGAHADLFRVVSNSTMKSFNDPDRVCINSSTMMDGLQVMNQPPWYFGNTNKIAPADSNLMIAAARYGFRGSKNIRQYNTMPYEVPSKTRTEYTPKFLDNGDFVNEWVPPISAAVSQSINGIETPKTWPENTEFVNGYSKKKLPKSWRYKRETTVDLSERPRTSENLETQMRNISKQDDLLVEYSRLESSSAFHSLPMTVQLNFDSTWKEKVTKNANSVLKHNLKREKPVYEAHTLVDPSDVIKYSGTTAMIVHSQTTEELKFRIRMDRSKSKTNTPYKLKWHHMISHFKLIQTKLKRKETMTNAIREIANALQTAAIAAGSETSIGRLEFIKACEKISHFEAVTQKQFSLLYSLFDPMKNNNMRFVEIIAFFTVLDKPTVSPLEKLKTLYEVYYTYGQDRTVFDMCSEILVVCVTSLTEHNQYTVLFANQFRPRCYELALNSKQNATSQYSSYNNSNAASNNNSNNNTQSNTPMISNNNSRTNTPSTINRPGLTTTSNTALTIHTNSNTNNNTNSNSYNNSNNNSNSNTYNNTNNNSLLNSRVGTATTINTDINSRLNTPTLTNGFNNTGTTNNTNNTNNSDTFKKKSLSNAPQFNICEHYLNPNTFISVLQKCPELVALFDSHMSVHLIACYGSDDRYLVEDVDVNEESRDFTWILKVKGEQKKQLPVYSLHG